MDAVVIVVVDITQEALMQELFSLENKAALITGASSGLGAHFARVLARAGADVALTARRVERLEELAAELEALGVRALPVAMDVTDPDSVDAALERVREELGGVDVLINNAGVSTVKSFLEHTERDWEFVVGTDLTGAWRVAQRTARGMVARGEGGAIVNIASIAGLGVGGQFSAYSTAKAGLIHLTRNMALELARHDIRVNALAPGYFPTEMNAGFLSSELGDRIRQRIPTRRFGALEDLDGPILLLCSQAGRHITGQVLAVDGGHMLSPL